MEIRKKVLIIKLSSMGDVIFNIPLANVLKDNGYEVSWLTSEKGIDIVKDNPCVDKVFFAPVEKWKKSGNYFANIKEILSIIKELRKEKFDIALDTQMRIKSLPFTLFCGAKRRIVNKDAKELSQFGANEKVNFSNKNQEFHVLDNYLAFAKHLGLNTDNIKMTFPESSAEVKQSVDKLLENLDRTKPIAVIAPSTTWIGKHWDKDNWRELVSKIEDKFSLIYTGMKENQEMTDYIKGKGIDLTGKTSRKELVEVLKRADLVISLDSGTTHLAWAVGIPKILSIFCCTPSKIYAPRGDENKYKSAENTLCKPCHHKKCPKTENKYICTKSPSVEEVYEKIIKMM